jgi:hypothetical protein
VILLLLNTELPWTLASIHVTFSYSDIRIDSFFMPIYRSSAPSSASNNLFGQPSFSQNNSQMPIQPEMKFGTSHGTASYCNISLSLLSDYMNKWITCTYPSVGTFGQQMTNQNQTFGGLQAPAPNFSFGKASNLNSNGIAAGSQLFTSPLSHLSANSGNSNASNKQQQQQLSSLGLGFASASLPEE